MPKLKQNPVHKPRQTGLHAAESFPFDAFLSTAGQKRIEWEVGTGFQDETGRGPVAGRGGDADSGAAAERDGDAEARPLGCHCDFASSSIWSMSACCVCTPSLR